MLLTSTGNAELRAQITITSPVEGMKIQAEKPKKNWQYKEAEIGIFTSQPPLHARQEGPLTVGYCMGKFCLVCHSLGAREAEVVEMEDHTFPECSGGCVSTTSFCLAHGTAILRSCAGSGQGQDSWHTHRLYPTEPCQGDGREPL